MVHHDDAVSDDDRDVLLAGAQQQGVVTGIPVNCYQVGDSPHGDSCQQTLLPLELGVHQRGGPDDF